MKKKVSKQSTKNQQKSTKVSVLKGKKKLMYEAMIAQLGVVTAAAKQAKIDRTTHYLWLREDDKYKKLMENLPDLILDFAEKALFRSIKKGNVPAQIFYLKTKGKDRGYVERQEIDSNIKLDMDMDKLRRAIKDGVPYQ